MTDAKTISERATARIGEMPKRERPQRLIDDESLEKALDWLRDHAAAIGKAKADLVEAEHMIGHVEALMMLASTQTSDMKRKADARASLRYLEAINLHAHAAGEYEKMKGLREAAALKIEAWRSEQANFRAMKI